MAASGPGILQRLQDAGQALLGKSAPAAVPELDRELAWGGTLITGGIVRDEHNAALTGRLAIQTAAKMRRSSAQVASTFNVASLPIRATEWTVEAPKDPSAAEKEATELIQENLFGGMEGSFDDLLREACLAIYYGFRVPEIVWEERQGLIAIRKIAGRNLERIERWLYDPQGQLAGYLFQGARPYGDGLSVYNSGTTDYERIPVPMEKVIHFAWQQEEDNPQGLGLWRPMYPHWYMLDKLYKVTCIGAERNFLDVPVGKITGGNVQQSAINAFLRMLTSWRSAESGAVVLRENEEVEFKGSGRSLMDLMPFIQHQDAKISQAALAQFLNLGQTGAGTQALASELVDIFKSAEDAAAHWIAETLNQQLLKRWLLYNGLAGIRAPRLRPAKIRTLELGTLGPFLTTALSGGLLHPLPEDEARIRNMLELPEIPLDQLQKAEQDRQAQAAADVKAQLAAAQAGGKSAGGGKPEQFTEHIDCDRCRGTQRFAETDSAEEDRKARDKQESDFADQARGILEGLQADYLAKLSPLVEDHGSREKIAKGIPLQQLVDVDVPGVGKYRDFVRGYLWDVLQQGRQALSAETGQDLSDKPVSNELRNWVTAKAQVIADSHTGQLRTGVLDRVLTGIRAQLAPSMIFSEAGTTAIETLTRAAREDWGAAAAELLAHVGAGRA